MTAQRRSERLQAVPIAVTSVSAAELESRGITDTVGLATAVPGLEYTVVGPTGTPYLRGVGSPISTPNAEASVAMYIDGVYQPFANANLAQLNNVERIEVLKGPQGTLFGRNATAGVIQVITRNPTWDAQAEMTAGYDNYQTAFGSFYGSAPITSSLAGNVAVNWSNQAQGWGRNVTLNQDTDKRDEVSVRAKLLYNLDDDTDILLTGQYRHMNLTGFDNFRLADDARALDGSLPPPGPYDVLGNTPTWTKMTQNSLSLHVNHDFGNMRFVSISAWENTHHLNQEDIDSSPASLLNFIGPIYQRNMSQEFQLLSEPDSPLDWVTGIYLYENTAGYSRATYSGTLANYSVTSYQRTRSAAAYAQATYEILPDLKFTAGIRYNGDWQRINGISVDPTGAVLIPQTIQSQKSFKPSWRLALDYAFSPDTHGYVSYNRGIKSGGFAILAFTDPGYKPEVLDAYEIGAKSELFDKRLRVNTAGFFYDYSNLQVEVTPAGSVHTLNAASAQIYGFEAEIEAIPIEHLTLSGGYTYLHGEYEKFDFSAPYNPPSGLDPNPFPNGFNAAGRTTLQTPKNSFNVSADYVLPTEIGSFTVSADVRYYGRMAYNVFNDFVREPYTQVNAAVNWEAPSERFGVRVFVRNLTEAYSTGQGVATGLGWLSSPIAPRTFGGAISLKY